MKETKKRKTFRLFDMNKDGKGVKKEDVGGPPNLKNFFKSVPRKVNKLLSLNLIMWGRLPMYIFAICIISYLLYNRGGIFQSVYATVGLLLGNTVSIASSPIFPAINGASIISGQTSSVVNTYMNVFGNTVKVPGYTPTFYIVALCVLLFILITWGWQSVGVAYISRSAVRGDPIFIFSDYFRAIKKNFKQAFFLGLIDASAILLLIFDFCYLYEYSTGAFSEILLFITAGLLVLYSVMRKYIYIMLITFDMKILKILKNALIFTVLGIKRNVIGSISNAMILILNIFLGIFCMSFNFIVPLFLPLLYYFGFSSYVSAYSVYPVIDKYMIEPYKKAHPEEFSDTDTDEIS